MVWRYMYGGWIATFPQNLVVLIRLIVSEKTHFTDKRTDDGRSRHGIISADTVK